MHCSTAFAGRRHRQFGEAAATPRNPDESLKCVRSTWPLHLPARTEPDTAHQTGQEIEGIFMERKLRFEGARLRAVSVFQSFNAAFSGPLLSGASVIAGEGEAGGAGPGAR